MRTRAENFVVGAVEELSFACSGGLTAMYKLSPFVWHEADRYELLLRVVPRSDIASAKIARVHRGVSLDGLNFALAAKPVIAPSPDPNGDDSGGCEDPSVAYFDGKYYVYYTGWNERDKRGELLWARGDSVQTLEKRGIALRSTPGHLNPKEAEIVRAADGSWRLLFEYARDERSCIGIARSENVWGPWAIQPDLFQAREGMWDEWHLSTGPVICREGQLPVMFYNGGTRAANWRIGWLIFDRDFTSVVARCTDPLVIPGKRRESEDTDIAFAASAVVEDDAIKLYYSIADRYVMRATITSSPLSAVR